MPIIKSAVKRMHQTAKRKARNQVTKRNLKTATKAFASAITVKDAKKAGEELKKVQSALDIAVKKNILKKNTAARKMSRLSAQAKTAGVKLVSSSKSKPTPAKKSPAKTTAKAPAKKPAAKKTPAKKPTTK